MANEMNKVPCGGFYLGDGLIMDGDTLKSSGGAQVQTDWTQNDTTAKDYIKNRPGGYEEGFEITWDGDTTGRVSMSVEGVPGAWYKVSDKILTPDQFIGGTMTMIQNGVSEQAVVTGDDIGEQEFGYMISFSIIIASETGDFNVYGSNIHIPELGVYFANVIVDDVSSRVSSLSRLILIPFDEKYIPDSIARKDEVYTNGNHTMSITWDGNKDGKDTFVWNAFNYYKISDNVPVFARIQSVSTTRSSDNTKSTGLYEGENCYAAGYSIVVTKAGACRLAANEGEKMLSFTAPSAGIYFWTNNTGVYQTSLTASLFVEQGGIIVYSANKKWKIAVDDNGAISATEITE